MKRIKLYLVACGVMLYAVMAGAQNIKDLMLFSQNEYYGTARSIGMGNAMTAIGGDLGSIGINPAGSAVANHAQITITPGITISSVSSRYSPSGESAFGPAATTNSNRVNMPNFGTTLRFDTGNSSGLKSFTLGFVANMTNQYEFSSSASGVNSRSSMLAEYANAAYMIPENVLESYNSYDNSDVSWDVLTAYMGGMFGSVAGSDEYVAVTEAISPGATYHYVAGQLSQTSYLQESGSKLDYILNLGLNFSDKLYVGANIGSPFLNYNYSETFHETAVDPMQFPIKYQSGNQELETQFSSAYNNYQYISRMDGLYAKIGVIYLPMEGLRLGAAIQTPTMYNVSEKWQYKTATSYTDSFFDDSQSSPVGEYSYTMASPYVLNLGAAYTFGTKGLLSVDYELTDYSVMRIYNADHNDGWDLVDNDPFLDYNMTNKYFAGVSHSLRIGVEYRLNPAISLRAGYNVTTDPEKYWKNNLGETVTADDYFDEFGEYYNHRLSLVSSEYYKDVTRSLSFGAGYSSPGSFFLDFATKIVNYPKTIFSPYYDYDGYDSSGNLVFLESPKISNSRRLINVVLTFGWRF